MTGRNWSNCAMGSALLLALSGAAARGEDLGPPTVKGNISIQFPKGWAVGNLSATAPLPDKDATGEFRALMIVSQQAGKKIDGAAAQASVAEPGYKPTEPPQNITVSGMPGVMFGGTLTRGALLLRSRQYMFTQNEQIYVVTIMCLNSKFPAYAAVAEASVATFKVSKANP